jgi:hypothetical protein
MHKTPKYYLAKATEFIGHRFGKLIVVSIADKERRSKDRHIQVNCLCDCGNRYTERLSLMKSGHLQSCGCGKIEAALHNIKKAHKVQFSREPKEASARKIYKGNYNDGDLSFEDFHRLSQLDCFYCGATHSNTYNIYVSHSRREYIRPERLRDGYFTYNGLDRIDNTRGHDKNNVVPCCWSCNSAKAERTTEEFYAWAHRVCQLHPYKG